MKHDAQHLYRYHQKKKKWYCLLALLAVVVALGTAYALTMPATALNKDTTCGLEAHEHSDACYKQKLSCDNKEADHKHTDSCYGSVLTCTKQEHVHNDACYPAHSATESQSDWEKSIEDASLTQHWGNDVVAIAKTQLGYAESDTDCITNDNGESQGRTRYGDWAQDPYASWNTLFVQFCLDYADVDEKAFPHDVDASAWAKALTDKDCDLYRASNYTPKPGDIVFLSDTDSKDQSNQDPARVGIVSQVSEATDSDPVTIEVIEGDSDGVVKTNTYKADDKVIVGYGELPENPDATKEDGAQGESSHEDTTQSGSSQTVEATETATASAQAAAAGDAAVPSAQADEGTTGTTLMPHKRIDAFRDGDENPDTELDNQDIDKTDLYRLYLDAELKGNRQPIDLLLIVDQSGSMHMDYGGSSQKEEYQDMTDPVSGANIFRDQALQLILNGCYNSSDNRKPVTSQQYESNKREGLVYQFLNANPKNKLAVIGFQGSQYIRNDYYRAFNMDSMNTGTLSDQGVFQKACDNPEAVTITEWISTPENINTVGLSMNGTNYAAGFIEADKLLKDESIRGDGNRKVVLFLSDGIPTFFIQDGRYSDPRYDYAGYPIDEDVTQNIFGGSEYLWGSVVDTGTYWRGGSGQGQTESAYVKKYTTKAVNDFKAAHPDITMGAVSISSAAANSRLQNMVMNGGHCYTANSTDALKNALKQLMLGNSYSNIVIQDDLSEYVDFYSVGTEVKPDIKVTLKVPDENDPTKFIETVLYENGRKTDAASGVLDTVTYDTQKKKIKATFVTGYTPKLGTTATLSFNVKTTQDAYDKFKNDGNKYLNGQEEVKGDLDTDYNGNATSSDKPGFYSNKSATVSYVETTTDPDGSTTTKEDFAKYPDPVVQVLPKCSFILQKMDASENPSTPLAGAGFTLYRAALEGEDGQSLGNLPGTYVPVGNEQITPVSGQLKFEALTPGNYWLVETTVPDGFMKPSDPIAITLSAGTNTHGKVETNTSSIEIADGHKEAGSNDTWSLITVKNYSGYELPNTGGSGTAPYIAGGILLLALAGLLAAKQISRRKEDSASS